MHASGTPRRKGAHRFSNHTPRPHEVQDPGHSRPFSAMFGPTGMAVGPVLVPLTAPTISETPIPAKAQSRRPANDTSSSNKQLIKRGSLMTLSQREEATTTSSQQESTSRLMSTELAVAQQQACSREEPFLDKMMTQTNLLVLPPSNPSYQMAYFLKTTGPSPEPLHRPKGRRISSAMRLFRSNNRRPSANLTAAHQRLNDVISEEHVPRASSPTPDPKLPEGVVQKISKTGRKYFEIEQSHTTESVGDSAPCLSPDILESRVSVVFADQASAENLTNWMIALESSNQHNNVRSCNNRDCQAPARGRVLSNKLSAESTVRILDASDHTPIRPPASVPVTPAPDSGIGDMTDDPYDLKASVAPLRSHPVLVDASSLPKPLHNGKKGSSNHLKSPIASDPIPVESPMLEPPRSLKTPLLAHPIPRRIGSQSLILQRNTSDTTGLRWSKSAHVELGRSVSDSPGPPPPRSPLRTNAQPRHQPLEQVIAKARQRLDAPSPEDLRIRRTGNGQPRTTLVRTPSVADLTALPQFDRYVPTHSLSTHDHSSSRDTSVESHDLFNASKIRSRYSKHNSKPLHIIDSIVKPSQSNTPRRRLRRARPEGPRPLDLERVRSQKSLTRLSGTTCGGQPSKRTDMSGTSQAPVLVTLSDDARIRPVADVSPKLGYTRRPQNAFLRGRKSPALQPRSSTRANMPPAFLSDQQHEQVEKEVCTRTPEKKSQSQGKTSVVLPSPPPSKELPPTPTKRVHRAQPSQFSIDAALSRAYSTRDKVLPSPPSARLQVPRRTATTIEPSIRERVARSSQDTVFSSSSTSSPVKTEHAGLEARLAAIERRNRLLEAALMAVLKTSGTLNGCPCSLEAAGSEHLCTHQHPMDENKERAQQHRPQKSGSSGGSVARDVLDLFKETKVRY